MLNQKSRKSIFKFCYQLLAVVTLIFFSLQIQVFATEYLPIDKDAQQIFIGKNIPVPAAGDNGQEIIKKLVFGGLGYVKSLAVVVGILYITILAYVLVTEGHNEEEVTKAKKGMIWTIIAFMGISMSQEIGRIFEMGVDANGVDKGTLLENPGQILNRIHLFDKQVEIVVTFIKYVIGAYATLMVVKAGMLLVTGGGSEEDATKNKKSIMYSGGGLILIYIGDIFINKVFYKVDKIAFSGITGVHPKVDAKAGVEQIVGIINFVVTFVGPIAVLMLIGGGIMYATAGGNDEQMQKAKRILIATAIGIVIIYGAFALVSTVIAGRLQDVGVLTQ